MYIFSASLGEPDIRNTFKSLSSMADIRTFFSLALQQSIVYETQIWGFDEIRTFSQIMLGKSFVLRTTLRLPTVLITSLLLKFEK